jgi:hypothetical protein
VALLNGLGAGAAALAAVAVALLWLVTGLWLGRRQRALERAAEPAGALR